jgi:hypothetical protein
MDSENSSTCTAGDLNQYTIRPLAFGGHCFAIRRCLPGTSADPNDPTLCKVDGLIIPPALGNQTCFFEVRAIGPKVGQKCSKVHAKKYRTAILKRYEHNPVDGMRAATCRTEYPTDLVGKRLFIALPWPLVDERVASIQGASFDFMVEETLPLAYMVEEVA